MSFVKRLEFAARLVEDRLASQLATLEKAGAPARLNEALQHSVLGGGKRFRPFLVIESAALFGISGDRAVHAAAAVELIHCYSLTHDDLPAMDNDKLRRGRPTVWCEYDEWTAILAGDALQALAFECLAAPESDADDDVRLELVRMLAYASGMMGMVGGQALDLEAEKLGMPPQLTPEHIRRLQAMKTGALILFCCEAGAVLGGADQQQRNALKEFGDHLGYAFQIADDLLDVEGDVETVGKAVAKDTTAGKATLVSLMGVEEARAELARTEAAAITALECFGDKAEILHAAARFVVHRKK